MDRRLLRSCRVPPASAERDALGVTNSEALPRLRRLVAYDEGDRRGQEDLVSRFGVTAGRTGVDLTVGRLADHGGESRSEARAKATALTDSPPAAANPRM